MTDQGLTLEDIKSGEWRRVWLLGPFPEGTVIGAYSDMGRFEYKTWFETKLDSTRERVGYFIPTNTPPHTVRIRSLKYKPVSMTIATESYITRIHVPMVIDNVYTWEPVPTQDVYVRARKGEPTYGFTHN